MNKMLFSILGIIVVSVLMNCSGPNKEKSQMQSGESDSLQPSSGTTAAAIASEPQFKVNETFQKQLGDVLTSYILLKEAFVSSDSNSVPSKAMEIRAALSKVEIALLSGEALNAGTRYLPALDNSLRDVQSTNNMEQQRQAFRVLSDSLYATIKAFGLGGKEAYYEFCPMAFNEEGAYWISETEKISNPYFGAKMLTCGEVKEKLK